MFGLVFFDDGKYSAIMNTIMRDTKGHPGLFFTLLQKVTQFFLFLYMMSARQFLRHNFSASYSMVVLAAACISYIFIFFLTVSLGQLETLLHRAHPAGTVVGSSPWPLEKLPSGKDFS